jgi:hypothetical protein
MGALMSMRGIDSREAFGLGVGFSVLNETFSIG